jgi:hypothetical protein
MHGPSPCSSDATRTRTGRVARVLCAQRSLFNPPSFNSTLLTFSGVGRFDVANRHGTTSFTASGCRAINPLLFADSRSRTAAMLVRRHPHRKVLGTTAPVPNPPELWSSIDDREPVPAGPPLSRAALGTPLGEVLLHRDGEPDVDDRAVDVVGAEATLTLDTDDDAPYESGYVPTEVAAGSPGAGQQLDIRAVRNMCATSGQQNAHTTLVQDLVAERTQVTFKTGSSPRPMVNGHVRDVFTHDPLTGPEGDAGDWAQPMTTVPAVPGPFPRPPDIAGDGERSRCVTER